MPATARPRVKPPALKPGDVVGIVAPASDINRELLEAGCDALRKLGYKPFYFDSILERDLYFAGSHERRVQESQEMFERDEVLAMGCAVAGVSRRDPLRWLPVHAGRVARYSVRNSNRGNHPLHRRCRHQAVPD